ncbi:hypothetical protein [Kalamiella sp. sgz302252]|uniref:hypothetical protein n=1 Tax=Pantoea sp. sgz302252 TaxID=3341827 RepID=UPI0036D2E052
MQRKIKSLIAKTELNIDLNEQLFFKNEKSRKKIINEIEAFRQEISALAMMIEGLYLSGVVDKSTIHIARRRQAVFRRKIANIEVQIGQKKLLLEQNEKEKEALVQKKKDLRKKIDKYDYIVKYLRQKKRFKELSIEEADTEEKLSWK